MKNNLIKTGMTLILSAFLFTSCEKTDELTTNPSSSKKMSISELTSNPQFVKAYKQMEDKFRAAHPDSRVLFIAPFFTGDGFVLSKDLVIDWSQPNPFVSGQFASFSSDLDGNDFFRKNNDGTVSVHISSNNALVSHYDLASNVELLTNNGKITMNYTGEYVSFDITDPFGNVLFTVNFIDFSVNPRAVSFHGNGQVSETPTSTKQNLVGRWVCNPGWTQTNIGFDLK